MTGPACTGANDGSCPKHPAVQVTHLSADGFPVTTGAKFWDNNLTVVQVTRVAAWSSGYADSGETQTWHDTTRGSSDTMSGTLRRYGRLARYFEGRDAELHEPGTTYASTKQH